MLPGRRMLLGMAAGRAGQGQRDSALGHPPQLQAMASS